MAREEHDRENLLAEATALIERASLKVPGCEEAVFAGFGRDGRVSFYFGANRVVHLTSTGALRRAFVDGLLYSAQRGRLLALRRRRTPDAVELMRRDLNDVEQREFVAEVQRQLVGLRDALVKGEYSLVGQVPADADVPGRIASWLNKFADKLVVASSPRAS